MWPFFVYAGVEKVQINPNSPLQKTIVFEKYPYSHSLVLTNAMAVLIGVILSLILKDPTIIIVFSVGCVSHWLLDSIVHIKDLPVLGFARSKDKKVGLGLWNHGKLSFIVEYTFYVGMVLAAFPSQYLGVPFC